MDKWGRRYTLEIGLPLGNALEGISKGTVIEINPPFTVEFDITRNTLTSSNVCQLRIYNLAPDTRNLIRFNLSNYGEFRPLIFRAGYGEDLPDIFTGNISQAWSVREGVNMITQIECYDGGFAYANGRTSREFTAGVPTRSVIQELMKDLPHISQGAIGNFPGVLSRGNSYSGNTTSLLAENTGGAFFIDKGKANALGTDEYIEQAGPTLLINAKSGLLGTPVLERTIVRMDMLFEPALDVGTKIRLESITEANFDGDYKVTAVKHRGMISEAVCGEVVTTGEFFFTKQLTGIPPGI